MQNLAHEGRKEDTIFSGNIYIFHAFDVGDDINLERVEKMRSVNVVPQKVQKYFKDYHVPVAIALPDQDIRSRCISCKIHNFGAISLTYKIPFNNTLKDLHGTISEYVESFAQQSRDDGRSIYRQIGQTIAKPFFSKAHASYMVIQVNPSNTIELNQLQTLYGDTIASLLRFETETLSEYQRNEIWESVMGYFRGDLIVVDTDASFVYDDEYEEILDLFEFANLQNLELQYFDRLLDQKLNAIYEGKVRHAPLRSYIPFIGTLLEDPIDLLWKLKVDISVITERLESTIKVAGEPYLSELYNLLVDTLDLKNWQEGIASKLKIVESVQTSHQHKIETYREDLISLLIVILIFTELIVGILHYYGR